MKSYLKRKELWNVVGGNEHIQDVETPNEMWDTLATNDFEPMKHVDKSLTGEGDITGMASGAPDANELAIVEEFLGEGNELGDHMIEGGWVEAEAGRASSECKEPGEGGLAIGT
ncbi:hypothetical protein GOBAR_AA33005 [Gossypium barbadense]|uniref:Uncharacterized protein n=1 Tax=Gossypium barbadense TaxID=3634 RepID=A0A2P5W9B3_GOSBA|nr:hypothetical protein GOBAR_AA33005 [Gossypium barbadense]